MKLYKDRSVMQSVADKVCETSGRYYIIYVFWVKRVLCDVRPIINRYIAISILYCVDILQYQLLLSHVPSFLPSLENIAVL
jgi:hypothetical protein